MLDDHSRHTPRCPTPALRPGRGPAERTTVHGQIDEILLDGLGYLRVRLHNGIIALSSRRRDTASFLSAHEICRSCWLTDPSQAGESARVRAMNDQRRVLIVATAVVVAALVTTWFVAGRGSGAEAATWRLDPSFTPSPESTNIPLLVWEAGCSSGRPVTGRTDLSVRYTDAAVTIDMSFVADSSPRATVPKTATDPDAAATGRHDTVEGSGVQVAA